MKKSAHFNDCHFTVTQIRTGMPQKQLPVSPEKKKRRKKVKGKFRLVTKKFPACCKAAVLKLKRVRSALSIASYLWSCHLCGFADWYAWFYLQLLLGRGDVSSLSDLPLVQFSSLLHPDCEDGRGPAPGWECEKRARSEIPDTQAHAGGLCGPGAGAAPVSHLHLPALLCSSGKMHTRHLVATSSRWWQLQQLQRVTWKESDNQTVQVFVFFLPPLAILKCG